MPKALGLECDFYTVQDKTLFENAMGDTINDPDYAIEDREAGHSQGLAIEPASQFRRLN